LPIVLGYHGCDVKTAQNILGGSLFEPSNKAYDWLGEGAYFWEWDVLRAYDWAKERRSHGPCVIGAAIDLGNCLDLTLQSSIRAVKRAHKSYVNLQTLAGKPLPINRDGKDAVNPGDCVIRLLDRAVIDHLHSIYQEAAKKSPGKAVEFETVRALFPEGKEIYPSSGFREKTHVQIAVKKMTNILGVFQIPQHQLETYKLPRNLYGR
jgi:hypothetical protein